MCSFKIWYHFWNGAYDKNKKSETVQKIVANIKSTILTESFEIFIKYFGNILIKNIDHDN